MIGIYKITNPNGKVYIGQAVDIDKRKNQYSKLQCTSQKKLYSSLTKYGFSNHLFEVIEECLFVELNTRERYWQDFYEVLDSQKGMNLKLTETDTLRQIHSEETRAKLSAKNVGKKHTEDAIRKMSEAKKGKESKKKGISTGPRSEEIRLKISQGLVGIERSPRTEEHMQNLSKALKGRKHSEESIKKSIESRTGKKRGPYKKREIKK